MRLLTEIAVYIGNGTKLALGCSGTLIRSHRQPIDQCRFRRPSVALKASGHYFTGISIMLALFDLERLSLAG